MKTVMDASALLAMLLDEKGGDLVEERLPDSLISTVNLCEVKGYLMRTGLAPAQVHDMMDALGLDTHPLTTQQANIAAELLLKKQSLSLGDRCCLALGITLNLPVLTADREWKNLKLSVSVEMIR